MLYPLLQALDEEHLGVDFQFGGVDQVNFSKPSLILFEPRANAFRDLRRRLEADIICVFFLLLLSNRERFSLTLKDIYPN